MEKKLRDCAKQQNIEVDMKSTLEEPEVRGKVIKKK